MPGNISGPRPALVMPQTLCTAFSEARAYEQLRNLYHDGTPQAGQFAQTSRRTFKLTRRLSAAQTATLRTFYENVGGGWKPFWFYSPYEASPVGSNYDVTGANGTGRAVVAFRSNWTQTTGLARTDIAELEMVELAPPDAGYLALTNFGPHGVIASAAVTVWATWMQGSAGLGGPVIDAVYGVANVQSVDFSADRVGLGASGLTGALSSISASLDPTKISNLSVVAFIEGTLYGDDTAPVTTLNIYDCYLDVTYADATTARIRPTSTYIVTGNSGGIFGAGVSGQVANPGNAIDADTTPPTTFASVTRQHFNSLSNAGYLQLSF
jgi:hypothetical protein